MGERGGVWCASAVWRASVQPSQRARRGMYLAQVPIPLFRVLHILKLLFIHPWHAACSCASMYFTYTSPVGPWRVNRSEVYGGGVQHRCPSYQISEKTGTLHTLFLTHPSSLFSSQSRTNAARHIVHHMVCRYYGKSVPFDKPRKHMQYLSSEQALADYAELLYVVKVLSALP